MLHIWIGGGLGLELGVGQIQIGKEEQEVVSSAGVTLDLDSRVATSVSRMRGMHAGEMASS